MENFCLGKGSMTNMLSLQDVLEDRFSELDGKIKFEVSSRRNRILIDRKYWDSLSEKLRNAILLYAEGFIDGLEEADKL